MNLFTQIHEIIFHGKGGYDWNTVYSMPIWLRKFTFFKILHLSLVFNVEHFLRESQSTRVVEQSWLVERFVHVVPDSVKGSQLVRV